MDGMMLAIKSDARAEIYRGITRVEQTTIERALTEHLRNSTQVDVLLRMKLVVDREGEIKFAGGLLLERLPESSEYSAISSEEFAEFFAGLDAQPVEDILVGLAFGKIGQQSVELLENRDLEWRCSCGQERVEAILYNMGVQELRQMLSEDGGAEVTCHFCNVAYRVDAERLGELIAQHDSESSPN